jgi:hypothetical protein
VARADLDAALPPRPAPSFQRALATLRTHTIPVHDGMHGRALDWERSTPADRDAFRDVVDNELGQNEIALEVVQALLTDARLDHDAHRVQDLLRRDRDLHGARFLLQGLRRATGVSSRATPEAVFVVERPDPDGQTTTTVALGALEDRGDRVHLSSLVGNAMTTLGADGAPRPAGSLGAVFTAQVSELAGYRGAYSAHPRPEVVQDVQAMGMVPVGPYGEHRLPRDEPVHLRRLR